MAMERHPPHMDIATVEGMTRLTHAAVPSQTGEHPVMTLCDMAGTSASSGQQVVCSALIVADRGLAA